MSKNVYGQCASYDDGDYGDDDDDDDQLPCRIALYCTVMYVAGHKQ